MTTLLWATVIAFVCTALFTGLLIWNFWSMFRADGSALLAAAKLPAHLILGGLASLSFIVTVAMFIWFLIDKYI